MVDVDEWIALRGDAAYRLAYLLSGNRVDAEAVVADALSRLVPRWSEVRATDDPEAYVRRLVVAAHLPGAWGRRRREPVAETRLGAPDEPGVAEQDRVWRACLALPPDQRVAVVLRHHERRDHAGIADLAGVSEDAARSQVSDGMVAVGGALDADEDLAGRVTESLAGTAERAPRPGDLVEAARARLRRRRRTATTVVAAVLAVVAVPVTLAVVAPGEPARPDRPDPVVERVPADWRVETWHDLTVWVPPDWRWGPGTDWCAREESAATTTPVVSRPDSPARSLGCAPSYGYGVHFFAPSGGELPPGTEGAVQQYRGRRYPYGAWLGYASTRSAAIWVVTRSREMTRRVLDTTAVVGEADPNGCPTQVKPVAPLAEDRVSVCHYDSGLLVQSEWLSADDSRAAVEAVRAAPPGRRSDVACAPSSDRPVVTLLSASVEAWLLPGRSCRMAGVFLDAGRPRRLTEDVLYWALSPGGWWDDLGTGVPVPDRLRTR